MNTPQNTDRSNDLYVLAGEYVLGTLDPESHLLATERLTKDTEFAKAVQHWEARFLPLVDLADPVVPDLQVWARIEDSLEGLETQGARKAPGQTKVAQPSSPLDALIQKPRGLGDRLWNNLALWRSVGMGGLAAAVSLAAVLLTGIPHSAPQIKYMVVLVAPQEKTPGWVIQTSNNRYVDLIPLGMVEVPQDKSLQFWTKADGWKGPVSLGLVKPGQTLRVPVDQLPPLAPNQLFELTLEPYNGSPIGRPTGPVQFIGRSVKVM